MLPYLFVSYRPSEWVESDRFLENLSGRETAPAVMLARAVLGYFSSGLSGGGSGGFGLGSGGGFG